MIKETAIDKLSAVSERCGRMSEKEERTLFTAAVAAAGAFIGASLPKKWRKVMLAVSAAIAVAAAVPLVIKFIRSIKE